MSQGDRERERQRRREVSNESHIGNRFGREVNGLIMQVERELLDYRGLPRRSWYRNLVYAPGYYEGYAAKTLPGVREVMEERQWDVTREQAVRLTDAINRARDTIHEAARRARAALPRQISRAGRSRR